jgi:hypothetical protein
VKKNLATLVLPLACVAPSGQQSPPTPKARFVAGELIVKFAAASEAARLAASPAAARDARGALASVTDRLSRDVGVPLEARRVLSGGEVLIAVGLPSLARQLLAEVRKDAALRNATLEEPVEKGKTRARPAVRARVAQPSTDAGALTRRLSGSLGFPVTSRAADGDEILLFVDGEAVTLRTLDRLKGRPEVEYAQPNYLLGKLGA